MIMTFPGQTWSAILTKTRLMIFQLVFILSATVCIYGLGTEEFKETILPLIKENMVKSTKNVHLSLPESVIGNLSLNQLKNALNPILAQINDMKEDILK